jgi:pilus assembly protein CpaE
MKIALITEDNVLLEQVHAELSGGGHEILTVPGKYDDLHSVAAELAPDLMLLDGRNKESMDLAHIERMTLQHPALPLLLLSELATPRFLLAAMRAGVREVLPAPQYKELLAPAVDRVAAKLAAGQMAEQAPIHAFIGASGGSGTTFLATNFGYQLAESHKVLLVDLNLQFGDALSFVQEGKAPRTIADLTRDIKRLDGALLTAGTVHVTPNYHILAAPDEPGQAADIRPEHVDTILKLAVRQYDIVLLDLPRIVDAHLMAALDRAASIYLVLQASVPHLRNADRLLSTFRSLDYTRDKIALILNRYDKRSEITPDKIRRTLGELELHTIANGYRQISTAINQGLPLVQLQRKHGVIRNLAALGDSMTSHAEPSAGMFQRLFGRA